MPLEQEMAQIQFNIPVSNPSGHEGEVWYTVPYFPYSTISLHTANKHCNEHPKVLLNAAECLSKMREGKQMQKALERETINGWDRKRRGTRVRMLHFELALSIDKARGRYCLNTAFILPNLIHVFGSACSVLWAPKSFVIILYWIRKPFSRAFEVRTHLHIPL